MKMNDAELARLLQEQFDEEANSEMAPFLPAAYRSPQKALPSQKLTVVSDEWETIDPTPDLHALFVEFDQQFFWGRLVGCEVRWSPRMTQCAGICRYSPRERFCTIGISIPLLKLRPRKDLVETLLHEMIHAYLFVTDNNKDHDGHGPEFHKHMYRINQATGASISVYHTFHDEVAVYKQHWWRCSGPCSRRPPFYGFVKRSMNRAPGPNDRWWGEHSNSCGGSFTKVKEPEGFGVKKGKGKQIQIQPADKMLKPPSGQPDIRTLLGPPKGSSGKKVQPPSRSGDKAPPPSGAMALPPKKGGNIFGFGGTSYGSPGGGAGGGGLRTKAGTIVVKPGSRQSRDNSSPGSAVRGPSSGDFTQQVVPKLESGEGVILDSSAAAVPSTAGLSAREAARLRWTNSFPPSSTGHTPPPQQSAADNSGVTKFELAGTVTSSEETYAACPICGASMPLSVINAHLDQCLLSGPSSSLHNGEIGAGKSRSNGAHAAIELSDCEEKEEDDEEPASKRRGLDLSTDQDDKDLLAALEEDWEPEDETEFTCPICLKMVPHAAMTAHLSHCLP